MADCEFSQTDRGFHPRDLYDPDADLEDHKPPECEREGCAGVQHDGYAGCCSMACAIANADDSADGRTGERDAARAPQEAGR